MATVRNTLMMNDSMGKVLRNVITTMNMTISTMEKLNTASDKIDLSNDFEAARQQIGITVAEINSVGDELNNAAQKQEHFNEKMQKGTSIARGLKDMLVGIGGLIGLKKLIETSDTMTSIDARLNLITGPGDSSEELKKKIFASARDARGLYTDMASSISKLGILAPDAFSNTDEIIAFTNVFQKMGIVSGSSASETSNAMYQLNQAMASNRLQGDEFRSIIENAPMLARAISDYMGISRDALKEMSSSGLITADVIKGAMFSVADEVDEKFKKMPMTWAQVWNKVINKLLILSEPLLNFISFIANNWDILAPIVLGAASAIAVYMVATRGAATATAIWTAIQTGFNAVMMLNPVTIVILSIIVLIGLIYATVAAINKFTDNSISATGIIMGAAATAAAFIGNIVIGLLNAMIQIVWALFVDPFLGIIEFILNVANDGFNSFGDAVCNLIGQIISWFLSLGKVVTTIIDAIFGTVWTEGLTSLQNEVTKWGKNDNAITLNREDRLIDHRFNYGDVWDKGYKFGEDIEEKIAGKFGLGGVNFDNLLGELRDEEFDVNVKNDVNLANESLKYLLDEVTQKYINNINLNVPAPKVEVTFTGPIERDVDLDELAEVTKQKLGAEMVEYAMSSTDIKHEG